MAKQQSMGKCVFCGERVGKASMTRHLSACSQLQALAAKEKQELAPAFHLMVEGRWAKDYWMHLAAPVSAPLRKLDRFLRAIWLECCGHLSAFEIGGIRYSSSAIQGGRSMKPPLITVLDVGTKFLYEYDYGSTTTLSLRVVGFWGRGTPKDAVELLARNEPPQVSCQRCGTQPAAQICTECEEAWLCEACAAAHECDEEMRLPVVNSPRVGVCAYTG